MRIDYLSWFAIEVAYFPFLIFFWEYLSPHGPYGRESRRRQGAGNRMKHPTSVDWRICRKFIFNVSRFSFKETSRNEKIMVKTASFLGAKMSKLIDLSLHPHKQCSFVSRLWFIMKNQNYTSCEILMVRKNDINFQWWDGFEFGFHEHQHLVIPLRWAKFELDISHWRWNMRVWSEQVF